MTCPITQSMDTLYQQYLKMNDILKDVTVVIQGPTNYYQQILENLDPNLNYIWSTWSDEPRSNLEAISSKMLVIIQNKFPNTGKWNINYQCASSEIGAINSKTKWVFKTRGDLLWTNLSKLLIDGINDLENHNHFASFFSYKPSINEIHDFVSLSTRENAIKLWSYRQLNPTHKSPEHQLCDHLCNILGLPYNEMVKRMGFLNVFMEEKVVDAFCIKYNVSLGYQCNINWGGVDQYPKKVQK